MVVAALVTVAYNPAGAPSRWGSFSLEQKAILIQAFRMAEVPPETVTQVLQDLSRPLSPPDTSS